MDRLNPRTVVLRLAKRDFPAGCRRHAFFVTDSILSFVSPNGILEAMSKVSLADVLELSLSERLQLVGDIWDSIAADPQPLPLTAAQRDELDRRLEDYRQHPEDGSPWEEVKARLLGAQ